MTRAHLLLIIGSVACIENGLAAAASDRPIGVVLESTGPAVIASAGPNETQVRAIAGKLLFPRDRIRATGGAIRFAYCPTKTTWILSAGADAIISATTPRVSSTVAPGPSPSFCELPPAPRVPEPSGGIAGQSSDGLPQTDLARGNLSQADAAARVTEARQFVVAHPADLLARIALATRLWEARRDDEATALFRELGKTYDGATFTRTFEHKALTNTQPDTAIANKYALLIGISKYRFDPPVPSLQFANRDAELFLTFLQTPRGGSFKRENIRILRDTEATRAAINQALKELTDLSLKSKGKNELVLFVAGHGGDVKTGAATREPYVLTYETHPEDPKTTGYPMAEFSRTIAKEAAIFSRVLVFVDVCHANEIGPITSGRTLEPEVTKVFAGKANEFGMMLAAQKDAVESSYFDGGHGVFTFYVIQGWNGAAAKGNTSIQFLNLRTYVESQVQWATNDFQVPETVAPSPHLILVDDLQKQPGIQLTAPTQPLPQKFTSRIRSKTNPELAVVSSAPSESQAAASQAASSFDEALRLGKLLPEEPDNAIGFLDKLRNDPSIPRDDIQALEGRLRVALEDRGQETILRYLDGDQIPQEKNDFVRGGRYFEEALKLTPDDHFVEARMLFCQGRALIFDHAYDGARNVLEKSIGIDPARSYAYNALGIAYLEQIATTQGATFDPALRAFHDAIRYAPNWAYPRHNLALSYSEQGNYAQAEREYADAMRIAPHFSYLPYNLALLDQKLRDYGSAERYYKIALDITVKNESLRRPATGPWKERAVIFNALGSLDATRERWASAEDWYRKSLRDYEFYLNARHNLALLLSRNGPSAEAESLWQGNLDHDDKDLPTLFGYANYLGRQRNYAKAEEMYVKALKLRPNYPGGRRKYADLLLSENKQQESLAQLRLALVDAPKSPELYEAIGDVEARQGNALEARRDWQKALEFTRDREKIKQLKKKLM
jgi:tetratricopeptide (TPR) repeat protein